MTNKKFILNADDFGLSTAFNRAVLEGHNNGFLKSASICANGEAFDAAVNEILPECADLGVGVHLNIIEGKALSNPEEIPLLVTKDGMFKNGYLKLIQLSNREDFLKQAEIEFRAQIEKVKKYTAVTHIDSHVHVHAIPNIFKLTAKLAKEYEIPQIRTQFERFYLIPDIKKHFNLSYPINIIKILLLNHFTYWNNKKTAKEFNLKTNDYLIGVGYTGMMDDKAIRFGLEAIKEDAVVEALIHPCSFSTDKVTSNHHVTEFAITQNRDLQDKIQRLGFEITNYKKQ